MKKKRLSSLVLFLTTTFSVPLLFSCGGPEVTAATGYSYYTSSSVSPDCTCKNDVQSGNVLTDATPSPTVTFDPTPLKTPGIKSTDKNYGWQSPVPGVTPLPVASASTAPVAPVVKKTLVGQWIEKIGNLFKKKKTA